MGRKAVVKMLSDKNLMRVQVVTEEEVILKVEIIDRANQLNPVEHVQIVIGSEQNVEENLEAFQYNVNLSSIQKDLQKKSARQAENVNPSLIKRNKVSPKVSLNDDKFAKTETNYEHNDVVTVQKIKKPIVVEEVPEKNVFGLGLSELQSDFDCENNNSNAVLTHSISLKKQKNPEKRFTVPHEISNSKLSERPGTADRKKKSKRQKSSESIDAEEL